MRAQAFGPKHLMDHFLTWYRYKKIFQALRKQPHVKKIIDFGCGQGKLVRALIQRGFDAYGIDVKSGERILAADLNHPIPLESESVDMISSLANLEHLNEPLLNLKEIHRLLRKEGTLVLTTPSTAAKPILEWMAFKLKIIDANEILDHKRYFSKKMLESYLAQAGFTQFKVKRFQLGLNLHAVAIKS